jgi:hypothetical protein
MSDAVDLSVMCIGAYAEKIGEKPNNKSINEGRVFDPVDRTLSGGRRCLQPFGLVQVSKGVVFSLFFFFFSFLSFHSRNKCTEIGPHHVKVGTVKNLRFVPSERLELVRHLSFSSPFLSVCFTSFCFLRL